MKTITLENFELVTSSAAEEARLHRDNLLLTAKTCPLVVDDKSQAHATKVLRELRNFSNAIESGRKEAKDPIIQLGRRIDAFAEELAGNIETEGRRLGVILGTYEMEQKRIAEQKRREAAEEEARVRREAAEREREAAERLAAIEREHQAAIRRQEEAIQREAAAKALRARTEAGRERAAEEARQAKIALELKAEQAASAREENARLEQQRRDDEETRRVALIRQESFAQRPDKASGTAVRENICFEVTDIVALYEAAPYLVNLSPNTAAIKSACKGLRGDQTLPGVRHWREASTSIRG